MLKPYDVLPTSIDGMHQIKLTENLYSGIIYTYGKVEIIDEDKHCRLKFDYDVQDFAGHTVDIEKFEHYIVEILQDLIIDGLSKNNLTYTGGVDENGTCDSVKSGS